LDQNRKILFDLDGIILKFIGNVIRLEEIFVPKMSSKVNKVEVNFKRLLNLCEKSLLSNEFQNDPVKIKKYLSVLIQLLEDLKRTPDSTPNMKDYSKRLDLLLELNDDRKQTPKEMEKQLFETVQKEEQPEENGSISSQLISEDKQLDDQRNQLTKRKLRNKEQLMEEMDEKTFQDLMEKQRGEQERITSDMVNLARNLKERNQQISDQLGEDEEKLKILDSAVNSNVLSLKAENERIKVHSSSSFSFTITLMIMMALVAMIFVSTFFFIKLNRK